MNLIWRGRTFLEVSSLGRRPLPERAVGVFSKIQLRQERDVYSLITKIKAKLQRSGALKLPSHVRLESKVIPQQRETPREKDKKDTPRALTYLSPSEYKAYL